MSFKAFSRDSDNNILLPTKSKRSQSALEYMMTYGWAILIIVIVAVILYSMGIFNPSSSVTFTSSGFSPFTVSSSLCNNLGYKIAVLAGPIPNNANSLQIDKVYLTSATGANATTASYTLKNPVTLKSGQSATILIPNVACNAANIHYSISANIQYSYTASTLGLQTVNTTGTVAGTSIFGKPSVLTSYEPVTITNSQPSATPNPFQQMVNFTSSDSGWTSISTSNFGQNVEFFYYNGTVIPSWLESYSSSNAIWWLKIAAIPAGSFETVYVGFAPTSTNLFNTVNDGEAPQIPCGSTPTSSCSNYAEYDDGNNVFNFYSNFAGTSLSSKWTNIAGSSPLTVDNGLTLGSSTFTNIGDILYANTEYNPKTSIIDYYTYDYSTGTSSGSGSNFGAGWTVGSAPTSDQYDNSVWGSISIANTDPNTYYLRIFGVDSSGSMSSTTSSADTFSSPQIISTIWQSSGATELSYYGNAETLTTGLPPISTSAYLVIVTQYEIVTSISWIRVRAYPPNGVMPSVTFGSVA